MKKLLFVSLLVSCPLFSMEVDTSPETSPNHAARLLSRQMGAVVLANEFTVRRRLFEIGDTAQAEETHAYISFINGHPVIVTTNRADNIHPATIRCDHDSKLIYSENGKYLLVSVSDKSLSRLKAVKIYSAADNTEVTSYCPNLSSITDMRLEQDELGVYILTISGRDLLTEQPARIVCEIPLESLDHQIRETMFDLGSMHF